MWSIVSTVGSSPLTRGKPLEGLAGLLSGRLIPAHAGKTRASPRKSSRFAAHPRSRGENEMANVYLGTAGGSSPLTRGKLAAVGDAIAALRLIPAHAGKTDAKLWGDLVKSAHPRSRGENRLGPTGPSPPRGSSPLTRGKRCVIVLPFGRSVAHPRSRGENCTFSRPKVTPRGSSPLTRGKPRP